MKPIRFKNSIAFALAFSLTFAPTLPAFADNFSDYCNKPAVPANADVLGAKTTSDQTGAPCAKIKVARGSEKVHKTESVIYGIAIAADLVAAALADAEPETAGVCKAFCSYSSYAVAIEAWDADNKLDKLNNRSVNEFKNAAKEVGTIALTKAPALIAYMTRTPITAEAQAAADAASAANDAAIKAGGEAGKAAQATKDAATKEAGKKAAGGCLLAVLGLAMPMANYLQAVSSDKDAEKSALKDLDTVVTTRGANGFTYPTDKGPDNTIKKQDSLKPISSLADASNCNQGGNAYLKCMSTVSPEVAALTNNSGFVGAMEKAIGGKSLGDFAKNYDGDGSKADVAAYVAGGMGLGAGSVAKIMDAAEKYASSSGDVYKPMTYSSSAGKSAAAESPDVDFSKMMGDMLKQLSPEDAANAKDGALQEMVFRKLDLLPPEKIEGNKEISLFARVGYRYRKKINDVDQLNWARTENQGPSPQSIAPAARAPANK